MFNNKHSNKYTNHSLFTSHLSLWQSLHISKPGGNDESENDYATKESCRNIFLSCSAHKPSSPDDDGLLLQLRLHIDLLLRVMSSCSCRSQLCWLWTCWFLMSQAEIVPEYADICWDTLQGCSRWLFQIDVTDAANVFMSVQEVQSCRHRAEI